MKNFCTMATALSAVMLFAACGATSSYKKQNSDNREIVWKYDNALQATKGGTSVAELDSWSNLPEAVACVPEAKELAESAAVDSIMGSILTIGGTVVLVGGVVAGMGVILVPILALNADIMLPLIAGGTITMGSLLAGMVVMLTGTHFAQTATVSGIDAVNIYNDNYADKASCRAE